LAYIWLKHNRSIVQHFFIILNSYSGTIQYGKEKILLLVRSFDKFRKLSKLSVLPLYHHRLGQDIFFTRIDMKEVRTRSEIGCAEGKLIGTCVNIILKQ